VVTAEVGDGADFVARVVAQALPAGLGQQVIVDNRPGAGGAIAFETVARAAPDGYTLLLFSNGMWTLPLLQKVNYDPVKDFAPVSLVDSVPNLIVVHPSLPVKTVKDLIALAKAKPGQMNWGAGSNGSTPHLAGELFKSMTGIDVVRIAYKGTAPALIDLLAGSTQFMFPNAGAVTPFLKSGKLKALAVTTARPSTLFPDLPTVASAGVPGYEADTTHSIFAPAATPRPVITRLNEEIVRALGTADVKEKLLRSGVDPVGTTPEQLAATVQSEMTKIGKVIKEAGIRTD
jgi:tripartite-type tricarboxylate transporter receptor subunit TctC